MTIKLPRMLRVIIDMIFKIQLYVGNYISKTFLIQLLHHNYNELTLLRNISKEGNFHFIEYYFLL